MGITLYGSYSPPSEMRLLENLRDFLQSEGYDRACLVKDDPAAVVGPLEASKRYLENSDVNFLIFTRGGKRLGVTRELAHVASAAMRDKVADCVVFDQLVDGNNSVPDLSMCDLHNAQITCYKFHTELDLRDGLLSRSQDYVLSKHDLLAKRPSI